MSRQLLLIPDVKERICSNLSLSEAIKFRDALDLPSLRCKIPVNDKDSQILSINHLDNSTILVAKLIERVGSKDALIQTIRMGNLKLAKFLLDQGVNINAISSNGYPALMFAAINDHRSMVELLLRRGADIDQVDKNGQTALIAATQVNRPEIVQILLKYSPNLDIIDRFGQTTLQVAKRIIDPEILKLLQNAGA